MPNGDLEQGPTKEHSMMRWVVRRTFWLCTVTIGVALAGDWFGKVESVAIVSAAFLALGAVTGAKAWQRSAEK